MIAYMRLEDGSLRDDVPQRERDVYLLIFESGHASRYVARKLKISRSSVQVYLRRLRARVGQ